MSSPAWGTASSEKVDSALLDLIQAGLVASDMADHYVRQLALCRNGRGEADVVSRGTPSYSMVLSAIAFHLWRQERLSRRRSGAYSNLWRRPSPKSSSSQPCASAPDALTVARISCR